VRLVLLLVAALLVMGLVLAALVSAEVVERRPDLPFTRFRIFDAFDLLVNKEGKRPTIDLLNTFVLLSCASVSLFAALLLRGIGSARPQWLFILAGLGTGFLALDETFAVHESLGHNLGFLSAVPGIEHPDDLIFALYAVPTLAFLVAFRDLILGDRRGRLLIGAAGVLYVVAAAFDVLVDNPRLEDSVEVVSSVCLLAALTLMASNRILPPEPASTRRTSLAGRDKPAR